MNDTIDTFKTCNSNVDIIKYAFKQYCIDKGQIDTEKKYLIEEYSNGDEDFLELYCIWDVLDDMCTMIENDGWIRIDWNVSDVLIQANKGLNYDRHVSYRKI